MARTKNDWIALVSLLLAFWFLLAGTIWVWGAALIIAYPFGFISLILWRFFLEGERKQSKLIPTILAAGCFLSLMVLFFTWLSYST
jgi:ABC-type phosphate transport system permease subunit